MQKDSLFGRAVVLLAASSMLAVSCDRWQEIPVDPPLRQAILTPSSKEASVELVPGVAVESLIDVSSLGSLWPKATLADARMILGPPARVERRSDGVYSFYPRERGELVIFEWQALSSVDDRPSPSFELHSYPPSDPFVRSLPVALRKLFQELGPRVHSVVVFDRNNRVVVNFESGRFLYLSQPLSRVRASEVQP